MAGQKIFIGPKLRELRQDGGLTQADLAKALGVSPSYVNLVERNQRGTPLSLAYPAWRKREICPSSAVS